MAGRIRSIKPEILDDELSAELSSDAWRLWVSMWLLADDHGRLRGSPDWLKAQVFWHEKHAKVDTSVLLDELQIAKVIVRYVVNGQRYIEVRSWKKHQKVDHPSAPRVPTPEEGVIEAPREVLASPRENLAKTSENLAPDPDPDQDPDPDLDQSDLARVRVMGVGLVGRTGAAWSMAGLPGLPGADQMRALAEALQANGLDPNAACVNWKRLVTAWRTNRNVLVKPVPAKMIEHIPFLIQIAAGDLDPDKAGASTPIDGKARLPRPPRAAVLEGEGGELDFAELARTGKEVYR